MKNIFLLGIHVSFFFLCCVWKATHTWTLEHLHLKVTVTSEKKSEYQNRSILFCKSSKSITVCQRWCVENNIYITFTTSAKSMKKYQLCLEMFLAYIKCLESAKCRCEVKNQNFQGMWSLQSCIETSSWFLHISSLNHTEERGMLIIIISLLYSASSINVHRRW